jgi:maltose alpha-D-glucosyltransferase/alpha-amylase
MINDLWYKNAVIYCLSVATYMDAMANGGPEKAFESY